MPRPCPLAPRSCRWGGILAGLRLMLEGLRVKDERDHPYRLDRRQDESGRDAGDDRRREDSPQHGPRLVTGEGEGMARIMGAIVNRRNLDETGSEHEDDAERDGRQRRNERGVAFGDRTGPPPASRPRVSGWS